MTPVAKSRSVAVKAVSRVRERAAFAHETLDGLLASARLDPRDSAFAARLALGSIAHRGTLDDAVARYLKPDVKLEPLVADALAVSAYEILHMRTPARAAVSQGVEMVRAAQPRAAGLANAVLRRLAEDAERFPWGDETVDTEALARRFGHPSWMVRMWIGELGLDRTRSMLAANDEPAPLFVVATEEALTALSDAGAAPSTGPLPGCSVLGDPAAAVRSGLLARADVIVADVGAQLAALAVPLPDQGVVADIGSGRGTKTLLMALRARHEGIDTRFVAIDVHGFKLEPLRSAARQLGLDNIEVLAADATDGAAPGMPAQASLSAALVDAPCSGLGTLRRHPDRRWRATPEEIPALAALGSSLLSTASSLVMPEGFVVYSTCTVTRAENHSVVAAFMDSAAGSHFSIDPLGDRDVHGLGRFLDEDGLFQSLPEVDGMDGHFIARIKRDS